MGIPGTLTNSGCAQHSTVCLSAPQRRVGSHDHLTSDLGSPSLCRTAPHLQVPADLPCLDDTLVVGLRRVAAAPSDLQGTRAASGAWRPRNSRSSKPLATPLSDGKPPRGAQQGHPFLPTASCSLRLCPAHRAGVSRNQTHRDDRPVIERPSPVLGEEAKTRTPFSRTPLRASLSGQRHGDCQQNRANRSGRLALCPQRPGRTYHARIYHVLRLLTDTQANSTTAQSPCPTTAQP